MLGPGRYARLAVGTRLVFLLVRLQPLALANLRWKPGSAARVECARRRRKELAGRMVLAPVRGSAARWRGTCGAAGEVRVVRVLHYDAEGYWWC